MQISKDIIELFENGNLEKTIKIFVPASDNLEKVAKNAAIIISITDEEDSSYNESMSFDAHYDKAIFKKILFAIKDEVLQVEPEDDLTELYNDEYYIQFELDTNQYNDTSSTVFNNVVTLLKQEYERQEKERKESYKQSLVDLYDYYESEETAQELIFHLVHAKVAI